MAVMSTVPPNSFHRASENLGYDIQFHDKAKRNEYLEAHLIISECIF